VSLFFSLPPLHPVFPFLSPSTARRASFPVGEPKPRQAERAQACGRLGQRLVALARPGGARSGAHSGAALAGAGAWAAQARGRERVQAHSTGLKRPGELALADPNGSARLQAVRSGLRASASSCGAKEQELGGTGGVDARELRRWSAGRRRSGRPRRAQTREQRRFG
jgi:hypothetical protein